MSFSSAVERSYSARAALCEGAPRLVVRIESASIDRMTTTEVQHGYKCPNLECGVEYVAIHRDYPPEEKPRCSECGTPFLAMQKGRYIHYQAGSNPIKRAP
jgi:hypothetical protein